MPGKRIGLDQFINGVYVSTIDFTKENNEYDGWYYETIVFGSTDYGDQYTQRYQTYEEAIDGHNEIVDVLLRVGFKLETNKTRWEILDIRRENENRV